MGNVTGGNGSVAFDVCPCVSGLCSQRAVFTLFSWSSPIFKHAGPRDQLCMEVNTSIASRPLWRTMQHFIDLHVMYRHFSEKWGENPPHKLLHYILVLITTWSLPQERVTVFKQEFASS